jgi:hypothetical protein
MSNMTPTNTRHRYEPVMRPVAGSGVERNWVTHAGDRALTLEVALQVLADLDVNQAMQRGRLRQIRDGLAPGVLRDHITGLLARPTPERAATYVEPWRRILNTREVEASELTPSVVSWLERLPADPTEIDDEEALHLERLSRMPKSQVPLPERKLIERAFAPVKAHHERLARVAELRSTLGSVPDAPPIPTGVVEQRAREWAPHLRDLLMVETPGLTEAEATARATNQLSARMAASLARRNAERHTAREELATPEMRSALERLEVLDREATARAEINELDQLRSQHEQRTGGAAA